LLYPAGGVIVCDIGNDTGEAITDAQLLFRGQKVFRDGAVYAPTYPPRISPLPFVYQTIISGVGLTETRRDNQLRIKKDADFVLRYGVCDPFQLGVDGEAVGNAPNILSTLGSIGKITEVYVTLRDESRKGYSNQPIHVNDLFGQGIPFPATPAPGSNDDQVLFFPTLYTPEIYIPADHSLYFDIVRDESDAEMTAVDLWFRWGGIKAFRR
jgi:hypothetical protein